MKKIVLILSFLAFLTFTKAQDVRNLRVGLIFSNALLIPSSDNVNIKSLVSYGFDYGISFDYFFTDNYAFSTGVFIDNPFIYRNNGIANFSSDFYNEASLSKATPLSEFAVKNGIGITTIGNQEEITGMHLNIPLSFKLKTNEIGYFKYFGDVGILNSFRIQSRYSLKGTDIQKVKFGKTNNAELPINYHTNLYNFSLKIGGGIEWTISDRTALLVGIYYYNGFVDFIEDGDNKATYMRKLSLRTGILF